MQLRANYSQQVTCALLMAIASSIGSAMQVCSYSLRIMGNTRGRTLSGNGIRMFATPAPPNNAATHSVDNHDIAIVGGGLAGLSAAYHLLKRSENKGVKLPNITIIDKAGPGEGGASSVAGGLLHPFSPRGKLLYLGREGLEVSNNLISASRSAQEKDCVLREQIYRIALNDKNVKDLQDTALLYPEHATWLTPSLVQEKCGSRDTQGGVLFSNGCKIIHVPTYLQGLWQACLDLSPDGGVTWSIEEDDASASGWNDRLSVFDTVVFSAGSGLFRDSILQKDALDFPGDLVRGQSVEMTIDESAAANHPNEAILCGKYVAPLPERNRVLIGATHEWKEEPFCNETVIEELRKRSIDFTDFVWENSKIDRVTTGCRVQTTRGQYGRMPCIGKAKYNDVHRNAWLFTGLSGRGLIYHGIYGKVLSKAILKDNEEEILSQIPEAFWWK